MAGSKLQVGDQPLQVFAFRTICFPFDGIGIRHCGCGNGIQSFVRDHLQDDTEQTSMEFAILGYNKFAAFSEDGDSGTIIDDDEGRVAALLTGGSGQMGPTDVTYGTPFEWLLERIKAKFPDAYVYPTTA